MKTEHWDLVARVHGHSSIKSLLEELYTRRRLSKEDIANQLGIHRTTVQRLMRTLGIATRKQVGLVISRQEALNLKLQEIAKRYGVTKATAWRAKQRVLKGSSLAGG